MFSDFRRGGVLARVLGVSALIAILFVAGCTTNGKSAVFSVTTASGQLATVVVNAAYPQTTLTAANGTAPYMWAITSGALPTGLTLSSAGVLSGTPTAFGTFSFTVTVTDSAAPTPHTATASLTVLINPALTSVTLNPTTVTGGTASAGTVTLGGAAASAASVTLASNSAAATVPASVTVAAGATTANFQVTTSGVTASTPVTITATYGVAKTGSLTVNPPTVVSVVLAQSTVTGGNGTTGTVTLSGPAAAAGDVVTLSSDNAAAQVPATVTVASGASTAQFNVTTSVVASGATAHIQGTFNSSSQSGALAVVPAPSITSFTSAAATITSGNSTTLTAVFSNGTGSVNNGVGAATSGTAVSVSPTATTTYTLTVTNAAGTAATKQVTVTVVAAPLITSFTAAATTITAGTSTTLTGVFSNGTGSVDNGVGAVTSGTAVSVSPAVTTTYTLTVTNTAGATATKQATVTVVPAPAITSFISAASIITAGTSTTLTGVFSNGTGSVDNGVGSVTSGTAVTVSPTATTTYTLTVTNAAGTSATKPVTVTVVAAPVITSFVPAAATITAGTSTTLTGVFSNGTGSVDNAVGVVTSGTAMTVSPASTTTYTLTVTNAAGATATKQATVTVVPAPVITSFTPGTATIVSGNSTTLTAVFSNGTGSINNGVGAVTSGTPVNISPTATTTYTLTVSNAATTPATVTAMTTVTVDVPPAITSANAATFTVGTNGTFTVRTTGNPTASLNEVGPLPGTVTFHDNGDGTATISGIPSGGAASYPITITASNGVTPNAVQTFSLNVVLVQAPAITSATSATFTVSASGAFTVTTTGSPTPALAKTGSLPTGVNFTDNGNGTAAISGAPAAGTIGSYPITITANNGVTPNGQQTFTLNVVAAPAITSFTAAASTITAGSSTTLTGVFSGGTGSVNNGVGAVTSGTAVTVSPAATTTYTLTVTNAATAPATTAATVTVTVVAAPIIASFTATSTTIVAGNSTTLTPTFSNGTGSVDNSVGAVTSGTGVSVHPTTTTTYTLTVTNAAGSKTTSTVTITVDSPPTITSTNSATFTVGVAGTFTVTTTGFPTPTLTETATPPSGVSFHDNGNGTGTLSWTAAVANGSYGLSFTASNGILPNATQSFVLTANAAPTITSANSTSFTAGTAGSFTVTATGFPTPALTETLTLPSGVSFHDNANGTGTLSWTAAVATGSYALSFAASNGVLPNATQSFTLGADSAPAITSANGAVFTVGVAGSFTVTTTGFPTPSLSQTATLPSGVSFADNGNGTGTLSWTTAVAAGTYSLSLTASNGTLPNATQSFTLTATAFYSVTGTVSYSGAKTGRTYIRVYPSGGTCTGNCNGAVAGTSLTSAPSPGGTSYTVRGLQPGNYIIVAEVDTLNNGTPNASNPWGSSSSPFTIVASNDSLPNIPLTDPTPPAPVAPCNVTIAPGNTFALVMYNQGNGGSCGSNNLVDSNGREIATSYEIYYDTNSSFTNNTFVTFGAHGTSDRNYIFSSLAATTYYFKMYGLVGSTKSAASPTVSAVIRAAGTGVNTVSGTVTFPGTATGPLYVGVFNGSTIYGTVIPSGSVHSPQAYSYSGVPAGNYQAFAIIDQNNNGLIEASDISNANGNGGPPPLTVGGGTTTNNVTLTSAISTTSVSTGHFQFQSNPDFYNLTLGIAWGTKRPVAMTLTSGSGLAVPWDLPVDSNNSETGPNLPNGIVPVVGSTYQLQVTFADNTTQALPASITADLGFAQGLTMITSGSGTPAPTPTTPWLSWSAPLPVPSITPYTYNVALNSIDNIHPENWNYFGSNQGNGIPSTTTSVPYDTDHNAQPDAPLVEGVTYDWSVGVQDNDGNFSQYTTTYSIPVGPASQIVFTQEPGSATAGNIMPTVQVSIEDASGAVVTSANNQITVAIGNNPSSGTLSGTLTVTPVNGVATFVDLSINNPGSNYTLTASASGTSFTATSTAFSEAGTQMKLGFTQQPGNSTPGSVIPQAQVAIEDAVGNIVTTAFNQITIAISNNPGGGTLSGTTTVNTVGGVATFSDLSINNGGNGYTLVANAPGTSLPSVISSSFNVVTSAPATCASAPTGKESVLSGRWVAMMQGWSGNNPGFPTAIIGSFDASGTGTFTDISGGSGITGLVDVNDGSNGTASTVSRNLLTAGSSYKVGLDPVNGTGYLGCMTLADSGGGSTTMRFSLSVTAGAATHGRIMFWTDTSGTGAGSRTSGVMMPQDATAFTGGGTTHLHSNYAFGESGYSSGGGHFAIAGTFSLTPATGAATSTYDYDSNGSTGASQTETLSITGLSGTYGRGVVTGTPQGTSTATHTAVYVVNANELFLIGIDPYSPGGTIYSGRAIVTGTSFTNASLTGNYALQAFGSNSGNSNCNGGSNCATVTLGVLNLSGTGTINNTSVLYGYTGDGTGLQTQSFSGTNTYSVTPSGAAAGRVTVVSGNHPPVLYLATPQANTEPFAAFLVGTDSSAVSGEMEVGASSAVNVSTLAGAYIFGSVNPSDSTVRDETGVVSIDSSGTATGYQYRSDASTGLGEGNINGGGGSSVFVITNSPLPGIGNVGSGTVAITNGTRIWFIDGSGGPASINVVLP